MKERSPLVLGALAGFLGVIAFRFPYGWPCIFISLIPLLYIIRNNRPKDAFIAGSIAGVMSNAAASWWIMETLPFPPSYGINQIAAFALVSLSLFATALTLGVWTGVWAAAMARVELDQKRKIILSLFAYMLSQFIALVAFNIGTAAPGIHNPLFYSSGFLGYPLADSSFYLQLASWGGIWMLTAFAVFINLLVFAIAQHAPHKRRVIFALGILLAVGAVLPSPLWRGQETGGVMRIGYMSLGDSVREPNPRGAIAEHARDSFFELKNNNPDVILLPEETTAFFPFNFLSAKQAIGTSTVTLIRGDTVKLANGSLALEGYASTNAGDTRLRNKLILVPNGEYLTNLFHFFLRIVGKDDAARSFIEKNTLANGDMGSPATIGSVRASVLFCSEMLAPDFAAQLSRVQNANVLLVASSHALFSGKAVETDTMRFAKVAAVESGLPLVTSVINGSAYALDRYGRVTDSIETLPGSRAVGVATISLP